MLVKLSSLSGAVGRFELVLPGSKKIAIVDYAHTPDALKNVLETIAQLRSGNEQVITVVGCGGNRDRTKRPVMGEVACENSDRVIFTSDNPRSEDPLKILEDMEDGEMKGKLRDVLERDLLDNFQLSIQDFITIRAALTTGTGKDS